MSGPTLHRAQGYTTSVLLIFLALNLNWCGMNRAAEATEYPWWAIIDPKRAALPGPADIDGGSCRDCGARGDEPCLQ